MAIKALNSERILNEIQKHLDAGVSYIDAVVDYADRNNLEIEVVGEIVKHSPLLKAMIQNEAEKLNMIEPTARLPI